MTDPDVLTWLTNYAEGSPDQVWELTGGHDLDNTTRENIMENVYTYLRNLKINA